MTALAGYWDLAGTGGAEAQCARMLKAQAVYAPDPPIVRALGEAALGRRLHRSLPEDAFDRGPVVLPDGRLLVADVRIDDRAGLGSALGIGPADANRLSDTDLLGHALMRWDERALDRIVGDFAFALWDAAARKLVLARDFMGQRPLHYHCAPGFVAFASMPKGLHALPDLALAPDAAAGADFLANLPESGSSSFFLGVDKVPSGHVVVITPMGCQARRYWSPDVAPLRLRTRDEYAEAMREQLDVAVAARLRGANGHVAAHMSGGLDSSAIAATAARLLTDGGRVAAFTAVPRAGYVARHPRRGLVDEGPLAAAIAAIHPNIDHVLVRADASPLASLDRNAFLYERPYLNLCNGVWIDAINDEARKRGLKIMLVGSTGNASFSFNGMPRLAQLLKGGRLLALTREAVALQARGTALGTIASAAIGPFLPNFLWRAIGRFRGRSTGLGGHSAILPAMANDPELRARAAARGHDFSYQPRADPAAAQRWMLGHVDFGNYNKGTLGGWGVDLRDPSADRRLVEFCLSVPADQYLADGVPRALARRAFADRLPAAVVDETRKGYQGVDWHEGLSADRAALIGEIDGIGRDAAAAGVVDIARLRALATDWPDSDWDSDAVVDAYRLALLRGVSMGHFMRKAAGTN